MECNTLKKHKDTSIWYAMCAYKKEIQAQQELNKQNIENFIPMRYELKERNGKRERVLIPAVSNLIFVYCDKETLTRFKSRFTYLQYIMQKVDSHRDIITIPDRQMREFIKVARKYEEDLIYYRPEEINLKKGTKVRVHGGRYDGLEGVLLKVKGKRSKRILIDIPNVITIAAAYIEPELIEVII